MLSGETSKLLLTNVTVIIYHIKRVKNMQLNKKRIVITGGTSGIGYQLVKRLQSKNQLIVIARDKQKLNQLTAEFQGVIPLTADLSNLEDVQSVANSITQQFDSVDVLINNAAAQSTHLFLDDEFSYSSIEDEITINLTSVCCLTYLLLPLLLNVDKGVVLNINSALSMAPKKSSAIYCASKGGLKIFSESLGYQLENTNVNVQQAFLPLVDTAMTKGRGTDKITAYEAAKAITEGLEQDIQEHFIGKTKLLKLLLRLMPGVARKIMKKH